MPGRGFFPADDDNRSPHRGGAMAALRFNHMELTLAPGELSRWRGDLSAFYSEVFDFDVIDFKIFEQTALVLRTDAEGSQFLLILEHERSMASPGYDHLGFLVESPEAVDQRLQACRAWQAKDSRVEILEYDPGARGHDHAFLLRPLWPAALVRRTTHRLPLRAGAQAAVAFLDVEV